MDYVSLQRAGDLLDAEALERFSGWRVGIVTSDKNLARATGLTFEPPGQPVLHGGLRVNLYRTAPLP